MAHSISLFDITIYDTGNAVLGIWILSTGSWVDTGVWRDDQAWNEV